MPQLFLVSRLFAGRHGNHSSDELPRLFSGYIQLNRSATTHEHLLLAAFSLSWRPSYGGSVQEFDKRTFWVCSRTVFLPGFEHLSFTFCLIRHNIEKSLKNLLQRLVAVGFTIANLPDGTYAKVISLKTYVVSSSLRARLFLFLLFYCWSKKKFQLRVTRRPASTAEKTL